MYRKIDWEDLKKKLVEKISKGTPVEAACKELGVYYSTVFRKMQNDTDFAIAIYRAEMAFASMLRGRNINLLAKLEQALGLVNKEGEDDFVKLVKDKKIDIRLLRLYEDHLHWFSERRVRDEYATKQVIEDVSQKEIQRKDEILKIMLELSNEENKQKGEDKKDSK